MVRIIRGDFSDSRIVDLLRTHLTSARAQTAPGSAHALDLAGLQTPDIRFWAIWDGEALLGIGALKQLSGEHGEVKSMHTAEAARRTGAGSAMLGHIIATARAAGMSQLSLETGSWAYFQAAREFYRGHGFVECAPFGDYVSDPNSVFMTLDLRNSPGGAGYDEKHENASRGLIVMQKPGLFIRVSPGLSPGLFLGLLLGLLLGVVLAGLSAVAHAQVAPVENPDQLSMLQSSDAKLAKNKQIVFDFWRIVYEGGHMDKAPEYMEETYIQHNPNVVSGRAAFIELFTKQRPPKPVAPRIKVPVVSIVAERDIVMVSTVRKVRDPRNHEHIYYMTWFDVFRIDDKGLIAEHWDSSPLWVDGKPPGAEFFQN